KRHPDVSHSARARDLRERDALAGREEPARRALAPAGRGAGGAALAARVLEGDRADLAARIDARGIRCVPHESLLLVQQGPAEFREDGQAIEPRRGVRARWVLRREPSGEAARDLALARAIALVVLVARDAELLVDLHVDRANAVARELCGGGLRRRDPDLSRRG